MEASWCLPTFLYIIVTLVFSDLELTSRPSDSNGQLTSAGPRSLHQKFTLKRLYEAVLDPRSINPDLARVRRLPNGDLKWTTFKKKRHVSVDTPLAYFTYILNGYSN